MEHIRDQDVELRYRTSPIHDLHVEVAVKSLRLQGLKSMGGYRLEMKAVPGHLKALILLWFLGSSANAP